MSSSLQPYTEAGDVTVNASLGLRFPTDAASTSRTNSLGIVYNTERAADELGGEIDRRTSQKSERDCVYDDTGLSHDRVLKLT